MLKDVEMGKKSAWCFWSSADPELVESMDLEFRV